MTDLLSENKYHENEIYYLKTDIDIKQIKYNDIELFVLKKDDKVFVALKKIFSELGLEVEDNFEIFEKNHELINSISKINLKIGNRNKLISFINIESLPTLLDNIQPRREDVLSYYENFKSEIIKLINDEFLVKSDYLISKAYIQSLSTIIDEMENENRKLKEENIKLKLENDDVRSKADSYELLLSAKNLQDMKQVANVFGVGRNKFFELLREKHILIDDGEEHNMPYQKYIDSGYFMVRKVVVKRTNGKEIKTQTLITPKGIGFLGKIFKNNKNYFTK